MFSIIVDQDWYKCSTLVNRRFMTCVFRSTGNDFCNGQVCVYIAINTTTNEIYAYGPIRFGTDLEAVHIFKTTSLVTRR